MYFRVSRPTCETPPICNDSGETRRRGRRADLRRSRSAFVELFLDREPLIAEHKHGLLVHPGADRFQRVSIMHLAQVDRTHFTREHGRELVISKDQAVTSGDNDFQGVVFSIRVNSDSLLVSD